MCACGEPSRCPRAPEDPRCTPLTTHAQVRLQCGLLVEAHSEVRAYCAALPPQQRARQVTTLIGLMAEWALAPGSEREEGPAQVGGFPRLQRLARLPLDAEEERALVGWLQRRLERGAAGGSYLAFFLLQVGVCRG